MADVINIGFETQEVVKINFLMPGPQGPAGADGTSDKTFTHIQSVVSASWTVTHNLGKMPSVTVLDSAGSEMLADVQHLSVNQCVITFLTATIGTVICN